MDPLAFPRAGTLRRLHVHDLVACSSMGVDGGSVAGVRNFKSKTVRDQICACLQEFIGPTNREGCGPPVHFNSKMVTKLRMRYVKRLGLQRYPGGGMQQYAQI